MLAVHMGLLLTVLELDVLNVVNVIRSKASPCADVGVVIDDILCVLSQVNVLSVNFFPRVTNVVARGLAKLALSYVVDTKGLAVSGFASKGQGVRTLHSAVFVKRHDTTTLETADGITVTISGLINRSRTCLNGFPLEVCNHFLLGFPHYWEEYADQCCGQESVGKGVPTRISSFFEDIMSSGNCSSTFPPFSLDEIPVTRVCDFIMSPQRDVENGCLAQKLFDDVVEKCGFNVVQDESACKQKKNGGQFKMDTKVFTPSTIVTRSMSRLKNNVMEQEESLSLKPSIGDEKTSKGRGKQSEGVGSESGSKECHQTTFAQEDKQVMGNLDKSTLRRSSRHMNQKKETHPHL
ncbi:hypothetical protein Q3G72_014642 [Acer saccharum]|nr:hypothetical protein Q3G72_014642 [Acer saccharum]